MSTNKPTFYVVLKNGKVRRIFGSKRALKTFKAFINTTSLRDQYTYPKGKMTADEIYA